MTSSHGPAGLARSYSRRRLLQSAMSAGAGWGLMTQSAAAQDALPQSDRMTIAAGGIEISYRVYGSGPPLLLIMDYGGSMELWDPALIAELASSHQLIVFDNRGIGYSTADSAPYTVEQLAADTAAFLQALGIPRSDVLGYSLGGFVAQELALRHPGLIHRLILYSTSPGGSGAVASDGAVLRELFDTSGSIQDQIERASRLLVPAGWLAALGQATLPIFDSLTEPVLPESLHLQARALVDWPGSLERLADLSAPTLVIAGTEDEIIPAANALLLAGTIKGSWLARIAGGGHGLMYQYPARMAAVVEAFLD
jgi:pimeloyl-ACP methyl ester carboxylesterase